MAQPTFETVTTDAGSGGSTFLIETVGSDVVPVDLVSYSTGDGTINAVTNSGTEGLPVNPDSDSQDPQYVSASSSAVAAGGQANLDSTQITSSKTGHILLVRPSASVPWKAELQTVTNGVASSTLAQWFWTDPKPFELPIGTITVAEDATAGLDGFRIVMTNLDPAQAADLYCFFLWDER